MAWSEINDRRNTAVEERLAVYATQKPGELVEYVGISMRSYTFGVTDLREKSVVAALTKPTDVIKAAFSLRFIPMNRLKHALEWHQ